MKTNNVIKHALMVTLGSDGSLEIIGYKDDSFKSPSSIVFMAKGDMVTYVFHHQPDFCKNCITTWSMDGEHKAVLIFEYSLRGELRNPQKLLKSIRNKLMQSRYVRHQLWAEEENEK